MSLDDVMWEGDWRTLQDKVCTGTIEVWDQTVGCPECGMNLWHLPESPEFWPSWVTNPPPADWWEQCKQNKALNQYDPFVALFNKLHPFGFEDNYDPGDEDDYKPEKKP